ncbi:MAG: agmatinase [Candidatus Aminicenantes bacterium]|nr:agmatinase [Candidatus Aminicenantes bacterium]
MTDFGGAVKKSEVYEIAILGIPFDEKSCFLKGAALGPQAIRRASTSKALNPFTELGINLETEATIVDLGDVDTSGDVDKTFIQIEEAVARILDQGAVPIILGGDHSITFPIIKAFSKYFHHLDLLHFDAHPDLYPDLYGDRLSHACPFARILEAGLIKKLVQIGIRAATAEQRAIASKYGVTMIEMKDLKVIPRLNFTNPLYISFDLDSLDPAFAPGVAHHEPGGLSTRQVFDLLHELEANIVGLDVVELNPSRDPSGITAAAAVKIIKEVAGHIIKHRQKKNRSPINK